MRSDSRYLLVTGSDEGLNYVAVAQIATGFVTYCGKSLMSAAINLIPGCCYEKGYTEKSAMDRVRVEAERFRQGGYE